MREIVVISGKGGTGKTSVTAAFAHLSKQQAILCDLDVDAPDLHLLLRPAIHKKTAFYAGHEAEIIEENCIGCGTCAAMCQFGAVRTQDNSYQIDPLHCEGCKVCVAFCPAQAIAFPERHCGQWYESSTRMGPMVHAQLFPGQENSGLLVSRLKKEARAMAEHKNLDMVLCDGAPGIGCPVISSLSQTRLAVIVTEPTPSGLHDLGRVAELCRHFRVQIAVVVNKCDINPKKSQEIEALCKQNGYPLIARLPHDTLFTSAMVEKKTITEFAPNSPAAQAVTQAWQTVLQLITTPE